MKTQKNILKLFWVFIIGCLAGFVIEGIVTLITQGDFQFRQGVIYGPFAQVYGIGTVAFYFILPKVKGNTKIFVISMFIGAITEYICSFLQETWFGTVSWEYSSQIFNLNGRTSLFYALCWGGIGIVFSKTIYPFFQRLDNLVIKKSMQVITGCFLIFMVFNFSISFLAEERQTERLKGKEASNRLESFLDEYYPDYKMNRVYANKISRFKIDYL